MKPIPNKSNAEGWEKNLSHKKIVVKRIRVEIKIKNKLDGIKKLNRGLNLKEKKPLTKEKKKIPILKKNNNANLKEKNLLNKEKTNLFFK